MLAQLVEVTSVQEVVRGLKAGKQRSKDVILKTSEFNWDSFIIYLTWYLVKEAAKIDNDIEAGPQKMSLKCPVRVFSCLIGPWLLTNQ